MAKAKWFAVVISKERPMMPRVTSVFVLPTTVVPPKLPPDSRLLGRVRDLESQAFEEAIEYLRAEVLVARQREVSRG